MHDNSSSSPIKVPADLLDSDLLYQRDAVLHAGMAGSEPLSREARRVLHALVSASEGEVIAVQDSLGVPALRAGIATLLVQRAVADVPSPCIVVMGPQAAGATAWPEPGPQATDLGRRWVAGDEAGASVRSAFVARAAAYLGRDPALLDLRGVRMGLRGRLDRINSARMILINVVAAGSEERAVGLQVGRLAELCGFGEAQEERLMAAASSLGRVDEALDRVRAQEFWLAVHVFECAWLEAAARGEEVPDFRLVELPQTDEAAALAQEDESLDLLGIVSAQDVPAGEASAPLGHAGRVLVTGDSSAPDPGSALCEGLAVCRWSFSSVGEG